MRNEQRNSLKDILRSMADFESSPIGAGWTPPPPHGPGATTNIEAAPSRWRRTERMSVDELDEWLERSGVLLLDVREPGAHGRAHIPGAISVPASDPRLLERVRAMVSSRYDRIAIYGNGAGCAAAQRTADMLDKAGFKHIGVLDGGLEDWVDSGRSAEGGPRSGSA